MDRQEKIRPAATKEHRFHLESDPQPQRNVICEHPEVAGRLKAPLDAFRSEAPGLKAARKSCTKQ